MERDVVGFLRIGLHGPGDERGNRRCGRGDARRRAGVVTGKLPRDVGGKGGKGAGKRDGRAARKERKRAFGGVFHGKTRISASRTIRAERVASYPIPEEKTSEKTTD